MPYGWFIYCPRKRPPSEESLLSDKGSDPMVDHVVLKIQVARLGNLLDKVQ